MKNFLLTILACVLVLSATSLFAETIVPRPCVDPLGICNGCTQTTTLDCPSGCTACNADAAVVPAVAVVVTKSPAVNRQPARRLLRGVARLVKAKPLRRLLFRRCR